MLAMKGGAKLYSRMAGVYAAAHDLLALTNHHHRNGYSSHFYGFFIAIIQYNLQALRNSLS
ncbi:MAG: hypothetical protein AB1757_17775 [Acidobacteriota bacterium]